jgi:hypothetical protein
MLEYLFFRMPPQMLMFSNLELVIFTYASSVMLISEFIG